jgi:hypothetical protein
MSGHSDPNIQQIVAFYNDKNCSGILQLFRKIAQSSIKSEITGLHLVTWPLPGEKDLRQFADFIESHKVIRLYSIGCGSGLLEWLMLQIIERVTNLPMDFVGVEIDSRWWTSCYSPPTFVNLRYAGEDFDHKKPFGGGNDLAIFCYFNNLTVFKEYLKSFQGTFIVLIGPISNEQFCSPGPLELANDSKNLPTREWKLLSCHQFGFINIDYIAIYQRME